jgi:hypothetical protein
MASDPLPREQRPTSAFIELAGALVNDVDTAGYLDRLTRHCVDLLAVAAAGVLVDDGHGHLELVAGFRADHATIGLLSTDHLNRTVNAHSRT